MNLFNTIPTYNPQQFPMQINTMFKQPQRIPRVNGREGANAFQMDPGSEALLLDLNDPIIWMVQTDDAGVKTIDALDVSKHIDQEQKAMASLEERVAKLEEAMQRESNFRNAERKDAQPNKPNR